MLNKLPNELLINIFSHLNNDDVKILGSTCKNLYSLFPIPDEKISFMF